jgi:cell wall-associated NlpC family hydrolase
VNASPRSVAVILGLSLGLATTSTANADAAPLAAEVAPTDIAAASAAQQLQSVALSPLEVRSVQRKLRIPADGVLDHGVRHAINTYQRQSDLAETAHPNVQTLRALRLGLADEVQKDVVEDGDGDEERSDRSKQSFSAGRQALTAALSQQGTPYAYGGTSPGGFDCSGLTGWAYAKIGISLPRTSSEQYGVGTSVAKSAVQAGDLVFFDTAGAGASHVGIALSKSTAVSATSSGGVMQHSIASGYWAAHYIGARHITD